MLDSEASRIDWLYLSKRSAGQDLAITAEHSMLLDRCSEGDQRTRAQSEGYKPNRGTVGVS